MLPYGGQYFSDRECDQFYGSNPENQNCHCYQIVLEPQKHDAHPL